MAIRSSRDEVFVISGNSEYVKIACMSALKKGGFTKIVENDRIGQIEAGYKKMTCHGGIVISLLPEGSAVKVSVKVTANVDNIFALFSSPTKKILDQFKSGLS